MSLFLSPQVRMATLDDAEAIAEVHVRSWQQAYPDILNREILDSMDVETVAVGWQEQLALGQQDVHVVDNGNGKVLAWASSGRPRDHDLAPHTGEIYGFYADPDYWGKGPAGLLMPPLLRHMRDAGYARVILWTLTANPRARAFYRKHGFSPDGARKPFIHIAGTVEQMRFTRDL